MEYEVLGSGYSNWQEVHGWMTIDIDGLDDSVYVKVIEVSGPRTHEVHMVLDFASQSGEHIEKVLNLIECHQDVNSDYVITDQKLINELFSQYGNNGK